jgi:hypothetical protein
VASVKDKAKEIDLSVPESPAFAALGLSPEDVIRPTSPRAFATSLLNGVDRNGNFQTGIAIDAAPYFLACGQNVTLPEYRNSRVVRFLSRIQLSLATAKGASENDKAARLGAGLRLTFWDAGDYRMNKAFLQWLSNLSAEARKAADEAGLAESVTEAASNKRDEFIMNYRRSRIAAKREELRKANWNASGFVAGFAPTWISRTGNRETLAWNGGAAWASLAYGFEGVPGLKDSLQVILHARYRNKDLVPFPDRENEYYVQNSTLTGARVRFGRVDTNGSFELLYLAVDPRALPNEQYLRINAGAERRIVEHLWLQFSVGGESGRRDNRNHLLLLTSLKWAFKQKED